MKHSVSFEASTNYLCSSKVSKVTLNWFEIDFISPFWFLIIKLNMQKEKLAKENEITSPIWKYIPKIIIDTWNKHFKDKLFQTIKFRLDIRNYSKTVKSNTAESKLNINTFVEGKDDSWEMAAWICT